MNDNHIMELKVQGYQVIEKEVAIGSKTSGRVYVPKEWIGKKVKIILLEEPNNLR